MLCTNYDEMVSAIPQIEKSREAAAYICGYYTSEGYEALCECIKESKQSKYKKYTCGRTLTKYLIFDGHDPIKAKDFYHSCIRHFEWQAIPVIENDCLFGKAYANAFRRAGDNYFCQIPSAKMVFEELAKLLRKLAGEGYVIAEDAKEYLR